MLLDISINDESLAIDIPDPFRYDLDGIYGQVERFAASRGANLDGADIRGLIPKLVKGIAGCENGCPADAKGLASRGYKSFKLEYIEGGILSARTTLDGDTNIVLKMFPDF